MFFRRICISSGTAALFALLMIIEDSQYPLLLAAAALIHEAGHIISAAVLRIPFRFAGAGIAGVIIEYTPLTLSYQKEIIIALSGAFSNMLAAGIFSILNSIYFCSAWAAFFVTCNFILALMNIFPSKVFDGGTVLKCVLLLVFAEHTAEKIYHISTRFSSLALWLFSVYIQLALEGNLSLLIISIYVLIESFAL